MKQSKICPKCNSHEIVRIPGLGSAYGDGSNTPLEIGILPRAVKVTRYLCGDCGYSEEWIDNQEDIESLKAKFGRKTD